MKTFEQGVYARAVYGAVSALIAFFFAYFAATLAAGSVSLSLLEWLSAAGLALATGVFVWIGITLRARAYRVTLREETLIFRRGGKGKAVALSEISGFDCRLLPFRRARYALRTADAVYHAVVKEEERAAFEALLPERGEESGDVPVLRFVLRERLKTLWVRLIAAAFGLVVAVVTAVPWLWAYFSADAAVYALVVMLVAFGAVALVSAIDYGVRELRFRDYRLELTGSAVVVRAKGFSSEIAYGKVYGLQVKENIVSLLFGVKRVKLIAEAAGESDRIPFLAGEEEVALLARTLTGDAGKARRGSLRDALPLALTLLLYALPVVCLAAFYSAAFLSLLLPAAAMLAVHASVKEFSVGKDAFAFSRGYAGRTTVIARYAGVAKAECAAAPAAMIFRRVNLKIYLPGERNVFYTGCAPCALYAEIAENLCKKVDIEG